MLDDPRSPKLVKLVKLGLFWSNNCNKCITHIEHKVMSAFADISMATNDDVNNPFKSISKTYVGIFPTTSAFCSIRNINDLFMISKQAYTGNNICIYNQDL